MARRGFFARVAEAISGIFQRRAEEPATPEAQPQPPEPAGYQQPYEPPEPSGYQQPTYSEPVQPVYPEYQGPVNEYGYPAEPVLQGPYEPDNSFYGMAQNYELDPESRAYESLYDGWYNPDVSFEDRLFARQAFFDEMGMEPADFDWDDWRDWYEATAA